MTPTVPRDITPFVRRRAWAEPRVRAWWLLALVLLAITLTLGLQQYLAWSKLHSAIASGVTVPTTIVRTEEFGQRKFSSNTPMILRYEYKGKTYEPHGTLEWLDRFVTEGDIVPVHIDPNDPENWTSRNRVPSLAVAMIAAILVGPVAIVAGLVAMVARSGVLKTYRSGTLTPAIVSANKQTPLAPRSRAIVCSLTTGGRSIEVFVPPSLAKLAPGEPIDLLLPPRGGRPLSAAWFEE